MNKFTEQDLDNLWGHDEIQNMLVEELRRCYETSVKILKELQEEIEDAKEDVNQYPGSDYNIGYFDGLKHALVVVKCGLEGKYEK